jgi:hypothetical protein
MAYCALASAAVGLRFALARLFFCMACFTSRPGVPAPCASRPAYLLPGLATTAECPLTLHSVESLTVGLLAEG